MARRIQDARLPHMKTLEEFDFSQLQVWATRIRSLVEGGYLERAEPIVLIGECGTGKTHLVVPVKQTVTYRASFGHVELFQEYRKPLRSK